MDPQTPAPHPDPTPNSMHSPMMPIDNNNSGGGKPSLHKQKRAKELMIGLGAASVILLLATIFFGVRTSSLQSENDTKYQEGVNAGAEAQKITDSQAREAEKSSDTRTYTAPEIAGGFVVTTPKHWSLAVTPNDNTNTISGKANPDYIDTKADKFALQFALKNQNYETAKKAFDALAAEKDPAKRKLTSEEVTVSGIKGIRYTGQLSSKIPSGTLILVPIRDKTYSIETDDNAQFLTTYNQIVSALKLNP